jgi:hypothetical protein
MRDLQGKESREFVEIKTKAGRRHETHDAESKQTIFSLKSISKVGRAVGVCGLFMLAAIYQTFHNQFHDFSQ